MKLEYSTIYKVLYTGRRINQVPSWSSKEAEDQKDDEIPQIAKDVVKY